MIKDRLGWSHTYRWLSYLRSTLWVVPLVAVAAERLLHGVVQFLDHYVTWDFIGLDLAGAETLFQTVITLNLSFIVFTFGSLLVAIQVASGQLTSRIIATTLLRDPVIKYTVGLNVFTLLFAISGLNRHAAMANHLTMFLGSALGLACLATFLFLIDYAARLLRPVRILALVCDDGMKVIRNVYSKEGAESRSSGIAAQRAALGAPALVVTHSGQSGSVLAIDIPALVVAATKAAGVIEFVPQVGDFVTVDDPLFKLYGRAVTISEHTLRKRVACGPERTMEQDPMFSFRILVDIALRALSPAVNDPTTAVLAMDQIQRLLRFVGTRRLHDEVVRDPAGEVRLVLSTPNWEDFVHISFTEIRACGANSVQVVRRMRAMLENLIRSLPESRHAALEQQLDLLERTLPDFYKLPEDLALARIPDSQGLGGAPGGTRAPGLRSGEA